MPLDRAAVPKSARPNYRLGDVLRKHEARILVHIADREPVRIRHRYWLDSVTQDHADDLKLAAPRRHQHDGTTREALVVMAIEEQDIVTRVQLQFTRDNGLLYERDGLALVQASAESNERRASSPSGCL